MKKFVSIVSSLVIAVGSLAFALPTLAAKTSSPGAQTYAWHLSGAVMPVPPYGLSDIPGSDTASKLIVNQPNGNVSAMATGAMNGLNPNTTYTVYLSNKYTPFKSTGWNVSGSYTMSLQYLGNPYVYTLTLVQSGNTITGNLNDPYLPGNLAVNGTITGSSLTFSVNYGSGSAQGVRTFTGSIDSSGVLSGNWGETGSENGSDVWSTTSGNATMTHTGDTGWPGLLSGVTPFTFTTDSTGSGSWHYNFKGSGPSSFSVWVNGAGGTILISDSITLN